MPTIKPRHASEPSGGPARGQGGGSGLDTRNVLHWTPRACTPAQSRVRRQISTRNADTFLWKWGAQGSPLPSPRHPRRWTVSFRSALQGKTCLGFNNSKKLGHRHAGNKPTAIPGVGGAPEKVPELTYNLGLSRDRFRGFHVAGRTANSGAPLDYNICERALKIAILFIKNSYLYKSIGGEPGSETRSCAKFTPASPAAHPFEYFNRAPKIQPGPKKPGEGWPSPSALEALEWYQKPTLPWFLSFLMAYLKDTLELDLTHLFKR